MNKKLNNKGFSLIELLIALAVSAIVMTVILALMGYTSNQMAMTQQKVSIQDEAKDILNHIVNYGQEGSSAEWSDSGVKHLIIRNNSDKAAIKRKEVVYWFIGNEMYFASTEDVNVASLAADKKHLLGENVEDFICEVKENSESKTKYITVDLKMKTEKANMSCTNNVYLRNQ